MRPDPSEHYWIVVAAWRRLKNCRVNHGRNDPGARSLTLHVLGNRAVAASYDRGPPNQIVRLAKPLQSGTCAAISRTSIRDVSGVIQIEHHRTLHGPCR